MREYSTIESEVKDSIGIIWLNRPELRNAFNDKMILEIHSSLEDMESNEEVRVVVIAARGKVFSAGADLNWMKEMSGYGVIENQQDAGRMASLLYRLNNLRKPTIARVHGHAFAGGMGLVAACDIAVAAFEAEFCLSEVKLGLIPSTIGPYVVAAMGYRSASRYMLTAERFDAAEAYRIGFVQEIAPIEKLDEKVDELLTHLVHGGPAAFAACKDLLRTITDREITPELGAETARRIAEIRASDEGREGIKSFLEKRKPSWVDGP